MYGGPPGLIMTFYLPLGLTLLGDYMMYIIVCACIIVCDYIIVCDCIIIIYQNVPNIALISIQNAGIHIHTGTN